MMKIDIQEKIKRGNYSFLENEPDLNNTIYLVASGSYGYGTNNENSDLDLRGVLVEPKRYIYGLKTFEQFEHFESDTVIYGLKKFIKLCMQGNPNTLELLGVNEDCIVKWSDSGRLLRDNSGIFLSKEVIRSFGNYAIAQLRRLQNALARDSYPQQEKEKHILNTLHSQLEHFKAKYTNFENSNIQLYTDYSKNPDFEQEIFMDIRLEHYPLRDFVNIYSEMSNMVRAYSKLNNRNRKKDEPHLYKHAMHLIRLLITGIDILEGNGIVTNRKNEQRLLLNIRNGKHSFDQIYAMADEYQAKFQYAAKNTELKDCVDNKEAEELMFLIYNNYNVNC